MLTTDQITPALIGALVKYDDNHGTVEYGLVRTYTERGYFFVSFGVGDTAQACTADQLTLLVPAKRPMDAPPPVPEVDPDLYNRLSDFLLSHGVDGILLTGELTNQIGRSAQKRAGRYGPTAPAET